MGGIGIGDIGIGDIRMGDIGTERREVEFEPVGEPEPAGRPVTQPGPTVPRPGPTVPRPEPAPA